MSIFTNIEMDFESYWANHVKPFIHKDIEPTLKLFFNQFTTTFGAQALTAALADVAKLTTPGAAFGAIAADLATTLFKDATTDAKTDATLDAAAVLQIVQSALQVAKAANNVVTPTDTQTAATITTAAS